MFANPLLHRYIILILISFLALVALIGYQNTPNNNEEQRDIQTNISNQDEKESRIHKALQQKGYSRIEILGNGMHGVVLSVKIKSNRDSLAVKVIPKATFTKFPNEFYFHKLAYSMFPNAVVTLRSNQIEEVDSFNFFAMEKMDGNLYDFLRSGKKLHDDDIRMLMYNMYRLLSKLNGKGIAIMDVKTDNILFNEQGNKVVIMKLADFGVALNINDGYKWEPHERGSVNTASWLNSANTYQSLHDVDKAAQIMHRLENAGIDIAACIDFVGFLNTMIEILDLNYGMKLGYNINYLQVIGRVQGGLEEIFRRMEMYKIPVDIRNKMRLLIPKKMWCEGGDIKCWQQTQWNVKNKKRQNIIVLILPMTELK